MKTWVLPIFVIFIFMSCEVQEYKWQTIDVTATAYNSLAYQTSSTPNITAWGDSLVPGKKYIAVSRDLIEKGLIHNTPVYIEGFDSLYFVKDKMNKRWRNKIDIYMGTDVKKAKLWGKRKLKITFGTRIKKSNK